MRAILVSVDYADLLAVTLPYNRHHFDEVMVVTHPDDHKTVRLAVHNGCRVHETYAFYRDGAIFNKWLSLEEGLDAYGRHGLMCIMDADVLWPRKLDHPEYHRGYLYSPLRRMMVDINQSIPIEQQWSRFPLHQQQREFAGFTQIFHADDPHLGAAPWHETDWTHCGGADSFFQAKWPEHCKIRPGWEVLHLGPAGVNWCGRASAYLDGTRHPDSRERQQRVRQMIRGRRPGPDRFAHEKLQKPTTTPQHVQDEGEPPR